MLLNIALSEKYNLAMLFDSDPDEEAPKGLVLVKIDIPPDNVKELIDKYIEGGVNIIVTPAIVHKCGLKEKDFARHTIGGESVIKAGSVDEITQTLIDLEKRSLEEE